VPSGTTTDGRCLGLQIAGKPGDEISVLRLAHAFEQQKS